jgi:hypothetical protein
MRVLLRRRAGAALLVAAFLLAVLAASLRLFTASSGSSAGAGPASLTPAAGGRAGASARAVVPPRVIRWAAAVPGGHVHPGYDTPADAVDGFYQGLLSGTPAQACGYVTKPCPSYGSRPITSRVTILGAVSHGGEALVEVTGTICVSTSCVPLTDRVVMPAGPASFGPSWTSLTSGVYGWAGSPPPCVQDPATRRWYVKLA